MNTPLTFEITFCVAENTYMYLPVYLASEMGIFESVFKSNQEFKDYEIKVSFEKPKNSIGPNQSGGDKEAVEYMLCESEKNQPNKIYIAIADPVTIFKQYDNTNSRNDIKVIGQLINKFPFWIVGKYDPNFQESPYNKLGVVKKYSKKTFYYPLTKYITASACTSFVFRENNLDNSRKEEREFEDVIKACETNEAIGLTGDLSFLAEERINQGISIICHLANAIDNDRDLKNIATVLITDSSSCHKYKNNKVLPAILEAIQNAIFIIYSSPKIASDVCQYVSQCYFNEDKNEEKIRRIVEIIQKDELYPMSLDIKVEDWINTINFYLNQDQKPFDKNEFPKAPEQIGDNEDYLAALYKIMYEETPAKTVEKKMINKFGVGCDTFDGEIAHYLKTKKKEHRKYILDNYGKDIITALLIVLIFIIILIYMLSFWHTNNINTLSHLSLLIGIVGTIISLYSNNKGRKIFKTFKIG